MMLSLRVAVLGMLIAVSHGSIPAQDVGINVPMSELQRALAAERRGDFDTAIPLFRDVLREHPREIAAVLGLSRALPALGRREELIGDLMKAIEADQKNVGLHSLAVRHLALLKWPDSTAKVVEMWVKEAGDSEEPYREWSLSALEARDRLAARRALELGQSRIPEPARLSPERAQLYQMDGDHQGATREWLRAVAFLPMFRQSAVQLLSAVPVEFRDSVLGVLSADGSPESDRLRGFLLVKWGDLDAGSRLLAEGAPAMVEEVRLFFRPVLDELRSRRDPAALAARGRLLEAQAMRETGAERVRLRMDAARAWADAGNEVKARELLGMIAGDPAAAPQVANSASTTLLGVLLAEGKIAEADSLLERVAGSLSLDERDRERRRLALAYARQGELETADRMLMADSSVAGFDARGRVLAFRGDFKAASDLLRLAGPFDDDREYVVRRVTIGALIQLADVDHSEEIGAGLLALERGDTVAAVKAFEHAAAGLGPKGAPTVLATAGELAAAAGDVGTAMRLYQAAEAGELPSAAAGARHGRAVLLFAAGDNTGALAAVESVLLDFPDSAVVPAARRLRDLIIGAIPGRSR